MPAILNIGTLLLAEDHAAAEPVYIYGAKLVESIAACDGCST